MQTIEEEPMLVAGPATGPRRLPTVSSAVTSEHRAEADVAAAAGGAVCGGRAVQSSQSFPHQFCAARW